MKLSYSLRNTVIESNPVLPAATTASAYTAAATVSTAMQSPTLPTVSKEVPNEQAQQPATPPLVEGDASTEMEHGKAAGTHFLPRILSLHNTWLDRFIGQTGTGKESLEATLDRVFGEHIKASDYIEGTF